MHNKEKMTLISESEPQFPSSEEIERLYSELPEDEKIKDVSLKGLNSTQVEERIHKGEVNTHKQASTRSYGQILRENLFTLFNTIIIVAMILVLITGDIADSTFGIIIIVNSGIGLYTEIRVKHILDNLTILITAPVFVIRNGISQKISHSKIVTDDLLWLRSGDQVPADGSLFLSWGLSLNESMLTGESRSITKKIGDAILSGSTVIAGMGLIRVERVGNQSYAAQLTERAKEFKRPHSELSAAIVKILKYLTYIVIPLCALLIWSQVRTTGGWESAIYAGTWRTALVGSVSGIVGMIPEGLVLLVSLNFAVAAMSLARHNTLVQHLESVETLARVDSLNLDKTGTLTDGEIVCDSVDLLPLSNQQRNLFPSIKWNDKSVINRYIYGAIAEKNPNATAKAMEKYFKEQNIEPAEAQERVPFSSVRKWSAAHISDSRAVWYLGAPEFLLPELRENHEKSSDSVEYIRNTIQSYTSEGYRVLLVCAAPQDNFSALNKSYEERASSSSQDLALPEELPSIIVPVAVILCSESIRTDAKETLAYFREQNVRCRIISGDNPSTVGAIARKVELCGPGVEPRSLDAQKIPDDPVALAEVLEDCDVLGRVLPEQKKLIVEALHLSRHVVAMTGDGVNDALAIREADLGIAVGSAAPATLSVSDIVLVDSKFSHLPDVVGQGRRVMANMERVSGLFLVKTVYAIIITCGVILFGLHFPYLPRHMAYISALTIGIPAFLLSLPPNNRRYERGFLSRVLLFSIPNGVAIGICLLIFAGVIPQVLKATGYVKSDLQPTSMTLCAAFLFILSFIILIKVSHPLRTWRGLLVIAIAICAVAGVFIPIVSDFFAFYWPKNPIAWWYLIPATLIAFLVFFLIQWMVKKVIRQVIAYFRRVIQNAKRKIRT